MSHDTSPPKADQPGARLVIADDHELARQGLRNMLEGQMGLDIVGEAANGKEALDVCCSLQPDLVLIDVRMPEMNGLQAARAILNQCPQTSVVIVTFYEETDFLIAALRSGAAGFWFKGSSLQELLAVVWNALEKRTRTKVPQPARPLTAREQEVLCLLARGRTNREIALELGIKQSTVKVHVRNILAKLDVSGRTQAAVRAVDMGLLYTC